MVEKLFLVVSDAICYEMAADFRKARSQLTRRRLCLKILCHNLRGNIQTQMISAVYLVRPTQEKRRSSWPARTFRDFKNALNCPANAKSHTFENLT